MTKRLIWLSLLLGLLPVALHAQNTQLSGTLNLPNAVGFNGTMFLSLPIPGSAIAACAGSGAPQEVMPVSQVVIPIVNGAMSPAPKIWGADCLSPVGLPYNVRVVDAQGNQIMTDQWLIQGSTFNIGTAVTTQPTPYSNPSVFTTPIVLPGYTVGQCLIVGTGGVVTGTTCSGGSGGGVGVGTIGNLPYYNTATSVLGDSFLSDTAPTTSGAGGIQYTGNGISAIASGGGKYVYTTTHGATSGSVSATIQLATSLTAGTHPSGSGGITITTAESNTADSGTGNIQIQTSQVGTSGGNITVAAGSSGASGTSSGNLTLQATGTASGAGNITIAAAGSSTSGGNVTISGSNGGSGSDGNVIMSGTTLNQTFGTYIATMANFAVTSGGALTVTGAIKGTSLQATGLTSGQCVQTTTSGLLATTGAACGSGGGGGLSGLTVGKILVASGTTTAGNSNMDEGLTIANTLTVLDTGGISIGSTGTGAIALDTVNFDPAHLVLAQTSPKVLSLFDPGTPGDTTLVTDNHQVNGNLQIGSTGEIGGLNMQGVNVITNNVLGSQIFNIGAAGVGSGLTPSISQVYMTLGPTVFQVPLLNSAGCLQTDALGNISSTAVACGSGGGGGGGIGGSGTAGTVPLFLSGGVTIGNSHITDSGSLINMSEVLQINDGTGLAGYVNLVEGTSIVGSAGAEIFFANASLHRLELTLSGGAAQVVPLVSATPGTSGDCLQFASNGYDITDAGAACGTGGGGGGTPTRTIDAGNGTGGTITFGTGATDSAGILNITTGTSPTASAGVVTINYAGTYAAAHKCAVDPASAAAAALTGTQRLWITSSTSTATNFVINAGATALAASTAYVFVYQCSL